MARYILLDGGDLNDGQPILDSDLIIEKDAAKFDKTRDLLQRRQAGQFVEGEIADERLVELVAQAKRKPSIKIVLPTGHTFYGGGFLQAYADKVWER